MPPVNARVFHVNINCSDLETSVAFYDAIGLTPLVRTTPERPQPGGAFGLDRAQWDAWIMGGAEGFDAVVVDLLEWKTPRPTRAASEGGYRSVRLAVPGSTPLPPGPNGDPDGAPLEIVAGDRVAVAGVTVGCSDLESSSTFYREVVGLSPVTGSTFCDERGPGVFAIDLVTGAAPQQPRVANDLGIYRLALLTDDIDRAYAGLVDAGVRLYSPPATLDMGLQLPSLRAVFFADPDGTTLELIEQPKPGPG